MKQFKNIKRFMFDSAQYLVSDNNGTDIVLKIDYARNMYAFESKSGNIQYNEPLRQEVANLASDLLKRKHGVNFAKQVR